ncbi:NAD(P)H-dependent oxidoreductase [Chryseobacterium antibioticum]|uniref:NAD(P)H-dependent oxidoreductase n=1 Tax=Chryseobacterium pyrolae TaxID=2987481 RepID=A0ABT2IKF2_9FLAO|nr:NAD(P)H-dependent oxidoreductase [Chryseobacterium pyrolae]MCT2409138.1 NAD(P)H-dependent oxidoreductase [Chryseobacterium pyrolae]
MKDIFVINGSASSHSSNQKLIDIFADLTKDIFNLSVFNELKLLPHFDPELSVTEPPKAIVDFRQSIEDADGILICTPEYVFSIPSGLKNAIEWCVSTTVFSEKPLGIITASANGEKGHLELQLIMETLMAHFTADTKLLIPGIKGKINDEGILMDTQSKKALINFIHAYEKLVL